MSRAQQMLNPLWGGSPTYIERVIATGPIAYWPLNETTGNAINCQINAAQEGTYTGVTLANGTAPDGSGAPLFDGASGWGNLQSATLAAAFSGPAGTLAFWYKPVNAGVWTDGTNDYLFRMGVAGGANYIYIRKNSTNNQMYYIYRAGGVNKSVTPGSLSFTAWRLVAITWDKTADQFKAYLYQVGGAGGQIGTTQTGLGTWAGTPSFTYLGSYDANPANPTNGWLAHVALWTSALSADTLAALAVAP
jgi:hypothetical protein